MISKYILVFISITNARADKDIDSPEAFLEKIQEAILYDESIPLIYMQEI